MFTDNLDNYKTLQHTDSCYLDGRYFNLVLNKYPGLIREPFVINIFKDKSGETRYTDYMKNVQFNPEYPGIMRIIINTPETRHSNLLVIDYNDKKLFRYEPNGQNAPYFHEINKIIEDYFHLYLQDYELYILNEPMVNEVNVKCESKGIKNGFCVAYNIKYAYDYLNNRPYDPSDILKFSAAIENKYGDLDERNADIEYGLFGDEDRTKKVVIGGLGGALAGGLITGSGTGALVGGLGGGLIGSLI